MAAQTVYSEGLAEEYDLKEALYTDNKALFTERFPESRFAEYTAAKADMEVKRSAAGVIHEKLKNLTRNEEAARTPVASRIKKTKNAVKKEFGKSSPEGKVFHVGEDHKGSSPVLIGWASDYGKGFPTYQERLAKQGVLPADIAALQTDSVALTAANKVQEECKTDAKQATEAFDASIEATITLADAFQNAATLAFEGKPDLLAKLETARKTRYTAPPHKSKKTDDKGNTSSSTSPSTDTTKK